MHNIDNRFDRMEEKLDGIADKLDDHMDRLARAETSLEWLRGHVKITVTVGLAILSGLSGIVLKMLKLI